MRIFETPLETFGKKLEKYEGKHYSFVYTEESYVIKQNFTKVHILLALSLDVIYDVICSYSCGITVKQI